MSKKRWAIGSLGLTLACLIALFFIMNMTNPSDSGPAGIAIVLLLIYGLCFGVIMVMALVLRFVAGLFRAERDEIADKTREEAHSDKRIIMICAALAVAPILVISLNSIGQIDFIDIALITATEAVAVFYIIKKV